MDAPIEKDEIHGQYIFGALTDGTTYAILSQHEQEICKAAARVATLLGSKSGVLPGQSLVPTATYYDKSSTHGAVLQRAIINTLARSNVSDVSPEHYLERSIHGEFLAQGEARHVLSVAEGRTSKADAGQYGLTGEVVGRSDDLKAQMKLQAAGEHYKLPDRDRAQIEDDIMNNYMGPEDRSRMTEMKEMEGKPYFIDVGRPNDLDFAENLNVSRIHQMLIHNKSLGNSTVEETIRAVHSQTVAHGSALRRAHPELGEDVYQIMYNQQLKAGARLLNLEPMSARQGARFMLNDMAIMHAANTTDGAGLMHFTRLNPDDRQNIIHGHYSKLSDDAKISVHSRLMNQHYVAPGLFQGASQKIAETETMAGFPAIDRHSQQAFAAAHQGFGR